MNSKIQYHVHTYLPLVPAWSQKNPVHTFKPHFLNMFLPSMHRSQVVVVFDSGLFRLFQKNPCIGTKKILFLIQNPNIEDGQLIFL
jgi:hypothetical protein